MKFRNSLMAALAAIFILPGLASAQHHGGGGGGHSGSAAGVAHGVTAGVLHGGAGHSGGGHYYSGGHYYGGHYYGGSHYYYGRPTYYSHHYYSHYYPYRHFYGGLGLGLFVASLPLYYDTIWWHGVPYYYSDGSYYLYNDRVREYEVVAPPEDAETTSTTTAASTNELFVYPKDGQSEDKQRSDRYECHQWATNQTGFDPSNGAATAPDKQDDYRRAEIACLTGRGYSVK